MTQLDTAQDLPSNWGRWGLDDELGTLNFITADARARGVAAAHTGRVVSLALPVHPGPLAGPIPFGPGPQPAGVTQVMVYTGSPARVFTDVLVINTHHSTVTHIDALAHIPTGDRIYPGVPVSRAIAGGTVRQGSTAAFAEGVTTRGVLLDLAPEGRLAPGLRVTGQDLDEAEQRAGVRLESGDALIVRGGWNVFDHLEEQVPAMTVDAVRWLAAREVSVYAGDISDAPPVHPSGTLAMHQIALGQLGMPLIDNADVSALATTCSELNRYSFLFVVGTPAIVGATGLPVNPLAIF
ncbi:cyclase family protein [Streptomyces sp. NPDC057287]|uniref:cyclase family protein n=1 Tax=Streptomyces sp. NPDC057287 TaxID=3346086 RepID=UPI003639DD77